MSHSSAARTNLTSNQVKIGNRKLGEGVFRVCVEGTFIGGRRNQQEAACKRFKPQYRALGEEFYAIDFSIADQAIVVAEQWNSFCDQGKEILISRGSLHSSNSGIQYLVEPLIRNYEKFTSNSGWIGDSDNNWEVRCVEAFCHFSYHATGGSLLVCDIQGRYRFTSHRPGSKCRFELSDPAICSRSRQFGPTDLGEKGIDSFFANHNCNEFCQDHWQRPRSPHCWFASSSGTSMMSSQMDGLLQLNNRTTFQVGLAGIMEAAGYDDSDDDDDDYY
jgi:Alpha-kinase family